MKWLKNQTSHVDHILKWLGYNRDETRTTDPPLGLATRCNGIMLVNIYCVLGPNPGGKGT